MVIPSLLPMTIASRRNPPHPKPYEADECGKWNSQTIEIDGKIIQFGRNLKGEVFGQVIRRTDDEQMLRNL